MRRISRIRTTALVAAGLVLVTGGAAFAYWTSGGTGTGTATTGTSVGVTVVQTSAVTGLAPGGAAQTLSGNFDNTNTGPAFVGTVTASISSVTKAGGAPAGTCDATDYTLTNAAMTVNAQVPAGTGQGAWTGATIQFNNKATVQDACKGATVNFAYVIS
jgi:hypothetical protein